jgi:hypothetical protein
VTSFDVLRVPSVQRACRAAVVAVALGAAIVAVTVSDIGSQPAVVRVARGPVTDPAAVPAAAAVEATAAPPTPTVAVATSAPPTSPPTTAGPRPTPTTPQTAAPTTVGRAAAASSSSSYRFVVTDAQGRPARWDPCRPVRWSYVTAGLPSWGLDLVKESVALFAAATGLPVEAVEPIATVPRDAASLPTGVDLVVAFGSPVAVPALRGRLGETTDHWVATPLGPRIAAARVVLDGGAVGRLAAGFGLGRHRGPVLLHELGHAAGLDHVADRHELMTTSLQAEGPAGYGPGDRAGLDRLGAASGCLPDR